MLIQPYSRGSILDMAVYYGTINLVMVVCCGTSYGPLHHNHSEASSFNYWTAALMLIGTVRLNSEKLQASPNSYKS